MSCVKGKQKYFSKPRVLKKGPKCNVRKHLRANTNLKKKNYVCSLTRVTVYIMSRQLKSDFRYSRWVFVYMEEDF